MAKTLIANDLDFLNDLPVYNYNYCFKEIEDKLDRIFDIRETILKALEIARVNKLIGKSLDAKVTVTSDKENVEFLKSCINDLASLFIVSKVVIKDSLREFTHESDDTKVLVETADGNKCARCWTYSDDTVLQDDGETYLCPRCSKILSSKTF